jgi:hypothetical protein
MKQKMEFLILPYLISPVRLKTSKKYWPLIELRILGAGIWQRDFTNQCKHTTHQGVCLLNI